MKQTHKMAQGIASLGRGEDKMLVHMTPDEVKSLQSIAEQHGGSLTINPATGLHEAGFLKSLLPMIAGGIATVMTGGAALPAILAGGATGYLTRDKGSNPWMAAAMGGLGGWGGAGIGKALAGAGAAAGGAGAAGATASNALPTALAGSGAEGVAASGLSAAAPATVAPTFANMGAGLKSLATDPRAVPGVSKYMLGAAAAPGIYSSTLPVDYSLPEQKQQMYENYKYYPGAYQTSDPRSPPFSGQRYEYLGRSPSARGYAGGGIVAFNDGGMPMGDGMSDSIPANIDGQQEAALSHGEFVVPADVVADIGNGSNEAGAQRLYAMMDRVRQMRHGQSEQPPAINPDQAMPV